MKELIPLFCVLVLIPITTSALPKRLIADYGYWSRTFNPPYSSANIPFSKITHVNHDGVHIKSDGTLYVPNGFREPQLLTLAHAANVQVLLLLGGVGATFNSVCGNDTLRGKLVSAVTTFINDNGYDGVDVDWEFPAAANRESMVSFMSELRNELPTPRYYLSIDIPGWGRDMYDFDSLGKIIDFFNVMTYDYAGPWTYDGQLNSPIFPDPSNPDDRGSVKESIDSLLINETVSPSQINMGTPFFGFYYENVAKLWGLCSDCNITVHSEPYGRYIKKLLNQTEWIYHEEEISQVPYLLRADGKPGFITYDSPNSTYTRVWYSVWDRGLGGTFMWALDQDYDGQSQDLLDAMYTATMKMPLEI